MLLCHLEKRWKHFHHRIIRKDSVLEASDKGVQTAVRQTDSCTDCCTCRLQSTTDRTRSWSAPVKWAGICGTSRRSTRQPARKQAARHRWWVIQFFELILSLSLLWRRHSSLRIFSGIRGSFSQMLVGRQGDLNCSFTDRILQTKFNKNHYNSAMSVCDEKPKRVPFFLVAA